MRKIAIFKLNRSGDKIRSLRWSNGWGPVFNTDYCVGKLPSPKELVKLLKANGGDLYLTHNRKKAVWVQRIHKRSGNLAKLLADNKIPFTVKYYTLTAKGKFQKRRK